MVLALDASISSTGYAVMSNESGYVSDFGKITTKKNNKVDANEDEDNRIFYITKMIKKIIEENPISVVIMEAQHFGKNAKTAMQLSILRGAIMYMIKSQGLQIIYMQPASIRKNLMDDGSASKEEVANYIRKYYEYDERIQEIGEFNDKQNKSKNSDIYDAISIGLAHIKAIAAEKKD